MSGDLLDQFLAQVNRLEVSARSCVSCRFWLRADFVDAGECRKRSPAFDPNDGARWPMTYERDWCGEWELRP